MPARRFAQQPLRAIPYDSVTDFACDRNAHAGRRALSRGKDEDREQAATETSAFMVDRLKSEPAKNTP